MRWQLPAIAAGCLTAITIVWGTATTSQNSPQPMPEATLPPAFRAALADAAIAEKRDIVKTLRPVPMNVPAIKVVTWKNFEGAKTLSQGTQTAKAVWVTLAGDVQAFCQRYLQEAPKPDLNLRLKQYLGLHPAWKYDKFVELQVRPADLIRPCVDPEVNDTQCNQTFGPAGPKVRGIENYKTFFQSLYFDRFRANPDAAAPWTGLGYTYDWGDPSSKVGASEYILLPQSRYKIVSVQSTQDYCSQPAKR